MGTVTHLHLPGRFAVPCICFLVNGSFPNRHWFVFHRPLRSSYAHRRALCSRRRCGSPTLGHRVDAADMRPRCLAIVHHFGFLFLPSSSSVSWSRLWRGKGKRSTELRAVALWSPVKVLVQQSGYVSMYHSTQCTAWRGTASGRRLFLLILGGGWQGERKVLGNVFRGSHNIAVSGAVMNGWMGVGYTPRENWPAWLL